MLNAEQIYTVAQAKIAEYKKSIDLLEPVLKALEKFAGKSITGNRAKILDTIKQVNDTLQVKIDKYKGFNGYFYDFEVYFPTTYGNVLGKDRLSYYHLYLFNLTGQRENIVDMEKIKENMDIVKQYRIDDIKQTTDTANNIEFIAKQVKECQDTLSHLLATTDSELTKAYGIDFHN